MFHNTYDVFQHGHCREFIMQECVCVWGGGGRGGEGHQFGVLYVQWTVGI